jgi:hypothetical protein
MEARLKHAFLHIHGSNSKSFNGYSAEKELSRKINVLYGDGR